MIGGRFFYILKEIHMTSNLKSFVIAVGASASNSGSPDIALVFNQNIEDGDTLTIGETTFTFRTDPEEDFDIDVGANLAGSLDNMIAAINASDEGDVITATENGSNTLTITYDTTGPDGNSYPVAWELQTATINPDGGGAAVSGSDTLDGGSISLTGGSGFHAIQLWGDGSVRFTTSGGQLVAIRDVNLNKLLAEIVRDNDAGLGPDHKLFGVTP
jgi:hypothetical protein